MAAESMRDADAQATAIVAERPRTTLVVVPNPPGAEGARAAEPARDGPLVGGRYRLVRRLGEGGAGIVWLAVHEVTAREVALKLLRPEASPHPRFVERFHRETRWTSRLQHPGIVQILDAGTEDGAPFVAMEYLDGVTLRDRLAAGGELDERHALRIARAIADAMAHAHAHGIVHRDLKPENVMLLPDGTVKLLDFGVAAPVDDGPHERMTCIGEVLGTPGYMAPEHSSGARATTAFDVYSYGMLLHELLGGGPSHPAWRRCEPLVAACTAGDPASRPRFVELVERLDHMLEGRTRGRVRALLASAARVVGATVLVAAAALVLGAAALVLRGAEPAEPVIVTAGVSPRPIVEVAEHGGKADVREPAIAEVPSLAVPPPPPMIEAAPESPSVPPRRVDCGATRRRMVEHREAYRWREMLATLSARSCWSASEYRRWATKASLELKHFARCARLGTGSPDPEVARWALVCRRRLAFSDG